MPAEVRVLGWSKGERSGTVVRGAGTAEAPFGPAALFPVERRWTLRSVRATTAGAGCRWSTWSQRTAPPCSLGRMGLLRSSLRTDLHRSGSQRSRRRWKASLGQRCFPPGCACMSYFLRFRWSRSPRPGSVCGPFCV